MEINKWIYLGHALSCILSCAGGPFLIVRCFSIPLQLFGGLAIQITAIYLLWDVKQRDCYETCALSQTNVADDIEFLDSIESMQLAFCPLIILLASCGCYQTRTRDAYQRKIRKEEHNRFRLARMKKIKEEEKEFREKNATAQELEFIKKDGLVKKDGLDQNAA